MVTIKEEPSYKNYGKCLTISNDKMELIVTVDVGPRIISCSLRGKENMLHEDVARNTTQDVSSLYGEGKTWNIYGGHRLWLSPEKYPDTYYPDNEKVLYTVNGSTVEFIPPRQEVTGLQYSILVEMDECEAQVNITHTITNAGKEPITGAAWALTVSAACGAVIVPQPKEDTGLLSNRSLVLWPYTNMQDSRVFWGKNNIALRQDPTVDQAFKIGINNTAGKLAYINHGQAMVKTFAPFDEAETYPDRGVNCEVYACKYFTETETLSPIFTVGKNRSITHKEPWTLIDDITIGEFTEESVAEIAAKLFG